MVSAGSVGSLPEDNQELYIPLVELDLDPIFEIVVSYDYEAL